MMTLVDSKGKHLSKDETCYANEYTTSQPSSAPTSPSLSPRQQHTNVYIHGLPPSTTDEALYHMCSAYGQIISSKSIIEPKTNLCRGYGFVMYEHLHQAQHAIYCLGLVGYEASFAKVRSDLPKQANLYVSNLPTEYSEQQLESLFVKYNVFSVRILRDVNNNSKGAGFVRLSTHASAQDAIKALDGTALDGSDTPLQVRFAEPPSRRFKPYAKPPAYLYHSSPPFYAMDGYAIPT
ncbi:hypothetical protein DSO57_1011519 [Entomophthora muscae]|nr:hypothetical protein DSO57_1011519 [Entomophthora muscae]